MSDMADIFNGMREVAKARKASNRERTPEVLRAHGLSFTTHNAGAHLIVTHGDLIADLWPGTGKYRIRGRTEYGRGVFSLIKDLGVTKCAQ